MDKRESERQGVRKITEIFAGVHTPAMLSAVARVGPMDKVRNAVDPECSVGEALTGVAQRATIDVGNGCKPGDTARHAVGMDGKGRKYGGDRDGPLQKRNKD